MLDKWFDDECMLEVDTRHYVCLVFFLHHSLSEGAFIEMGKSSISSRETEFGGRRPIKSCVLGKIQF